MFKSKTITFFNKLFLSKTFNTSSSPKITSISKSSGNIIKCKENVPFVERNRIGTSNYKKQKKQQKLNYTESSNEILEKLKCDINENPNKPNFHYNLYKEMKSLNLKSICLKGKKVKVNNVLAKEIENQYYYENGTNNKDDFKSKTPQYELLYMELVNSLRGFKKETVDLFKVKKMNKLMILKYLMKEYPSKQAEDLIKVYLDGYGEHYIQLLNGEVIEYIETAKETIELHKPTNEEVVSIINNIKSCCDRSSSYTTALYCRLFTMLDKDDRVIHSDKEMNKVEIANELVSESVVPQNDLLLKYVIKSSTNEKYHTGNYNYVFTNKQIFISKLSSLPIEFDQFIPKVVASWYYNLSNSLSGYEREKAIVRGVVMTKLDLLLKAYHLDDSNIIIRNSLANYLYVTGKSKLTLLNGKTFKI